MDIKELKKQLDDVRDKHLVTQALVAYGYPEEALFGIPHDIRKELLKMIQPKPVKALAKAQPKKEIL